MARGQATADIETTPTKRELIFDAFRRWGYLQADLDPLGDLQPLPMPELDVEGKDAAAARAFYCGTIGAEFMHIPDAERRRWIAERMESEATTPDRTHILERIVRAEIFEQVLQTRYLGTKRYSLEGDAALIPLLDSILDAASTLGAEQGVVAMSHRGRLNVMVHTIGRAAADVFARFEDVDPRSVLGGGDVKYHLGATGEFITADGSKIEMHMVSNPSHLEAVDPVAMGRARAKQTRIGANGQERVLPILLHGDAAFAGQGIWAETLNYAGLDGFTVGGSVHIIVNNLIGFTTVPSESHSSRFSSDRSQAPPDSHLPRECRRSRRGSPRGPHRRRIPLQIRKPGGDRSDRLPQTRPQRSRRSHHHATAALPQNPGPPAALANLFRKNRRRCRAHGRKSSRRTRRRAKSRPKS